MKLLKWEQISAGDNSKAGGAARVMHTERTYRAKVPGGWLVQITRFRHETVQSAKEAIDVEVSEAIAMSFVPDQNHSWTAPL